MKTKIAHLTALLILLFSMFLPTQSVFAATIWYVESTADGAANAAHCPGAACTLRDAVAKASPGDTILFNLPTTPADITLTNGQIAINKNLTIQGPGSSDLTVSGNLASRIFQINQYNVTISGMTLLDGRVPDDYGGAIYSNGNLTLNNMLITQNATTAVIATYLRGGGISQNGGSLTITNSQITENYAAYGGGGLSVENAPLSMTNVTVSQNQTNLTTSSTGGGIDLYDGDPNDGITASATLNQVSILNNTTNYTGGGMNISGPVTVTLSNVTIRGNETIDNNGGGISAYDANNAITINITNNSTIQDNLANGAFGNGGGISTNGSLSVTDSSLINNSTSHDGGAINAFGNGSTVTLTNAILSGNQSNGGAGIYAANISSLTITDSNITNNQAQTYGGGLYYGDPDGHTTIQNSVISGNQVINGGGGGLSTSGDLSIEDTTISGNSSLYDGGGISYYSDNKSFTLNRVTISGNSATSNAGGLYLLNTGTGSITNSTLSGNSSTNGVGGVFANASTSVLFNHVSIAGNTSTNYVGGLTTFGVNVSMKNSIIADNTGGGAYASFPDCLATIQSQDYNLIEKVDSNCGLTGITTHNITGQDPKLDTLKNNGGSTLTMGLLSGSPAIDPAGNTSCITEDQRGYSRPQDGDNNSTATCDIGALEVSGTPAVHVTRLDADPTSASSVRFLVRFTEPVNGVDKTAPFADFELSPIGLVGTSILSVTGSGAEYTVTVNIGTGNGSIGLDVGDNDSITSIASGEPLGGTGIGNGDYLNGERYTVDRIPPQVTTITRASTSPTNAANVDFTVTFSENVTGVGTSDFTLTTTGVSSAAVSGISGSGSSYTVTVNTGSGNGTIRLDVLNDNSIKDTGDNSLSAGYTSGPVYTIEKTAPSVLTSVRANANPTNLSSVDFTVTFSENVTGVDTSDFTLTTTGVSSAAVSGISGSGSSYTVTVNTGSGNGTIRLDVVNDGSIENATLNSLTAGFTNGEIYTVVKSATFSDVPLDYWANNYIERLYNAGITGGCVLSPLQYCPDTTVTRAQMAIFLLKGIHGSSYTPPAMGVSTGFGDVAADYWAAAWIKQLAAEGITSGCGNGNYCPETTVTRAQMAIFLLKAKHGSSYSPTTATGVFNDVPVGYWADKWIEQLAVEGVTSGCGNGNYCPEADVTRAQMAIFLVKAFGLP